ncbi:MAG: histidine phosphatase family protein [Caulobacteraceae bacterium]|nr:histidine phosphatase family protein [Caulobacteraceae bacterium]
MSGGAVILARHGRPALSRRAMLNAEGYRDWWARYELGGLKSPQAPPADLVAMAGGAARAFSSVRRRSIESARAVLGDRPFDSREDLIEAPLPPPPLPALVRLTPRLWGVLTRFCWWFFDHHDGAESRAEAEARAAAAATFLAKASEDGDVFVIAHGFFNAMIARVLEARGWRRTVDQGFKYWSARRFERPHAGTAALGEPGARG